MSPAEQVRHVAGRLAHYRASLANTASLDETRRHPEWLADAARAVREWEARLATALAGCPDEALRNLLVQSHDGALAQAIVLELGRRPQVSELYA